MSKLIVTGGRNFDDKWLFTEKIESHLPSLVIVGDCPTGADKFAREWCKSFDVKCTVFKADWKKFGKSAGPRRNEAMIDNNPDATVLAFPTGGPGTKHCIDYAKKNGLEVYIYE